MKSKKKYLITILFLVLASGFAYVKYTTSVKAASNKAKAQKAYEKLLSKKTLPGIQDYEGHKIKTKSLSFALADLDKDSVPELILCRTNGDGFEPGSSHIVYYFAKGKVKLCTFQCGLGAQALKYYPKTGIIRFYIEDYETQYCKVQKGKIKPFLVDTFNYDTNKPEYYYKNKKIKKATLNKKLKQATKGKKAKGFKLHKNTKKNRKKYL